MVYLLAIVSVRRHQALCKAGVSILPLHRRVTRAPVRTCEQWHLVACDVGGGTAQGLRHPGRRTETGGSGFLGRRREKCLEDM